tara:strand:+ start:1622 stop:1744 length:123 start_codon:yes stop_codon:yes gene_type:complete
LQAAAAAGFDKTVLGQVGLVVIVVLFLVKPQGVVVAQKPP